MFRNEAFLDVPEPIAGVKVLPFTLRHWCMLKCIESPFIMDAFPMPDDVAIFFWSVSPGYHPKAWIRKYFFTRSLKKRNRDELIHAAYSYLKDVFIDCPTGGSSGFSPPYWSAFANVISELASEYGWSEEHIMRMPLKRVWQYVRIVRQKQNPKETFSNTISGGVRQRWLDEGCKRN